MDQAKALNALEPFVALSKSASSPRAAADLITRATSHPHTFIFTELLLTPQIQALRSSDTHASYLRLLEIFSYGTYADYTSTPGLPTLNPAQLQKLKQLTLLTLSKDPSNLTYKLLLSTLDLKDSRALEDLVISAIYSGLVTGTLDPYNGRVAITSVSPLRDLAPGSLPGMIATLADWSARCATTLEELEAELAQTKRKAQERHAETEKWNYWTEKCVAEYTDGTSQIPGSGRPIGYASARGGPGGPGKRNMDGMLLGHGYSADGTMELDEDGDGEKQRRGGKILKKRGSVAS